LESGAGSGITIYDFIIYKSRSIKEAYMKNIRYIEKLSALLNEDPKM
jgi:hypothetical protein